MKRKGIILAGGSGTRLYPLTLVSSKQLLPIYDKPMIYYPMATLMENKIREILLISSPDQISSFQKLFGRGERLGINLKYKVQKYPNGLAESLILAEDFLNGSPSVLILGDNIFYGSLFSKIFSSANKKNICTIFAYSVNNPQDYGVLSLKKNGDIKSIVEKPVKTLTGLAVTGIYFYCSNASAYAKKLKPSKRGELEITDLNNIYLKKKKLDYEIIDKETIWLDCGSCENLLLASEYFRTVELRQGIKVACLEEIAFKNSWISADKIKKFAIENSKNSYGKYLLKICEQYKNRSFFREKITYI
jgi:glucose-1-phosphate thymidylyltransferase